MRVIYLHQYFTTPSMSGGTRSYEMAKRLVQSGHEVHIVTSWRQKTEKTSWFHETIDGINVHWLPVEYSNSMSFGDRIKAFFNYAFKAGKKACTLGGDVVFATSTPLTIAIPGVYVSKKLKLPMVFEVRDLWPELPIAIGALKSPISKFMARKLERFAYHHSKRIIALSPGMAEGVIKTGYPADRVTVIPNSADLDLFKPDEELALAFRREHAFLGDGPIILYAGTLGLINGVAYLAQLASEVKKLSPEMRFVVIGGGMEWDKVKGEAENLGVLNTNFYMIESLPKIELVKAFSAASVSVSLFVDLKPMEVNSANKFFDSLASGTPVAINYGGWQQELLQSSQAGIRLSRDIKVAAQTLVDFVNQEGNLDSCSQNARKLAENEFSRDELAKKFEQVLVSAIGQDKQ